MENSEKKYIVFAGVNGAGKSTLYYLHPEMKNIARINMDEIARSIGDWRDMSVSFEAGKRTVELKNHYLSEGVSFNQETTLCGHDPVKTIRTAKNSGYIVEMHYVGVDSAEICKARIRKRVADGGHGVPDDVIERRYRVSFDHLNIVIPDCDRIWFYDNTRKMTLFATYDKGLLSFVDENIPEWFMKYVKIHT